MNAWQSAHQLKFLLEAARWPDSPQGKVFGAVRVSRVDDERILNGDLRLPLVVIDPGAEIPDAEEGLLEELSFDLNVVQAMQGQDAGVAALMGGPRSGGAGTSLGRGILELEEPLKQAVARLTGADGLRAVCRYSGAASSVEISGAYYIARRYQVTTFGHAVRHYEAPRYLKATGGSGQVSLVWTLPPSRWDYQGLVLRRAAGSTAPTTASAGTDVVVGRDATSITVTGLSAGVHSFALFAAYDETGSGGPERFSDQEADTIDTATVT